MDPDAEQPQTCHSSVSGTNTKYFFSAQYRSSTCTNCRVLSPSAFSSDVSVCPTCLSVSGSGAGSGSGSGSGSVSVSGSGSVSVSVSVSGS
eukprot:647500-Hanusia_phi.AAC.5